MQPIKKAVSILGITQADFAEKLDVSPAFVSQMVSGHRRVPPALCQVIEDLTDGQVTCHDLRPDVFRNSKAA